MFQFNYIVFDMFRPAMSSSSGRLVHAVLWHYFLHPYKKTERSPDHFKHILTSIRLLVWMLDNIPYKIECTSLPEEEHMDV